MIVPALVFFCAIAMLAVKRRLYRDNLDANRIAARHTGELRYAPLGGSTFTERLPAGTSSNDSMIVATADGRRFIEDAAILHLWSHLGGLRRVLSIAARIAPSSLRRRAYHVVGVHRIRWFGTTEDACPNVPQRLRDRVLT